MRYQDARPQIKTGDLLLFSHTPWGSWYDFQVHVVRMFTESAFSHVGIAWVANGRVFVLESVTAGVRIFPLSMALPFYWVVNPKECSQEALDWAFSQIGVAYEPKWKMVLNVFVDMGLRANKYMQCSKYYNRFLEANGEHLTDEDTPSAIGEAALRQWGALTEVEA